MFGLDIFNFAEDYLEHAHQNILRILSMRLKVLSSKI
jgi:hypothetical protein